MSLSEDGTSMSQCTSYQWRQLTVCFIFEESD